MEIQGLLQVCDIRGIPAHQLSCGQAAPTIWLHKFCCLSEGKIWMIDPEHLNQTYREGDGHRSSPDVEYIDMEHADPRSSPEDISVSDAHDRLHRGEVLPGSGSRSYIQRKISPATRLTRSTRMTPGKENVPCVSSWVTQGIGAKPESEIGSNFFVPTIESPEMLDLSVEDDAVVRPLHHSILGKEHCFEVITVNGSRCFCCKSAGEREAWIEKLKRILNPNLDNSRRMEHQLSLWVQEAKGIQIKKKYFCEICLDRQLHARTTSKLREDGTTFWGEQFEFTSIPDVENITIHLYKDSDKKKKKDKDYVGLINISIKSLRNRQTHEKWYPLSTPSGKNKNNSGETMAIRIKARFQSFCILPMEQYKEMGDFITRDYMKLCKALHGTLSVSKKDELSKILVHVMHGTGMIKEFMTELVMNDIAKVEEESLIFRENTLATKAVEHFLRLVGMGYLHETLGDFVSALYESEEDCEVDGSRLPITATLEHNQKNLQMCCEIAMHKILGSIKFFPLELREVFSKWRHCCEETNRSRIASRLITASLFLRLICPSILNPYLFGLANEIPKPNAARTLTLVAKVIQNLANRSRFGDKEEYMKFMNVFVREQWDQMGSFLNDVADVNKTTAGNGFEGFIDVGREMAKLHAFMKDSITEMDQSTINNLGRFPEIVSAISRCVDNPPLIQTTQSEADIGRLTRDSPGITTSLDRISEDVKTSNASENLASGESHHGAKTLGMVAEGLPALSNIQGSQFQSDRSISTTGSFNNSNNSQRPFLAPLENVMQISNANGQDQAVESASRMNAQRYKPPLSFTNPAYLQQNDFKRGLSSPAVLSSLAITGDGDHTFKGTDNLNNSRNRKESIKNPTPLSFSNPLQSLRTHASSNHNSNNIAASEPSSIANLTSSVPLHATREKLTTPVEILRKLDKDIDQSTLESSHSDHVGLNSDDTLSSRQSSTTTSNSENNVKESTPPERSGNQKNFKLATQKNKLPHNEAALDNHSKHRKLSAPVLPAEFNEHKVTAVATSTTVPILSARHCVGLQRRQPLPNSSHHSKQQEMHDTQEPGNVRRVSVTSGPPIISSPRGNKSKLRSGRTGLSSVNKPLRNRFPDPQSVMTPIDGPDVKDDMVHGITEKTLQPVVSNTANAARVRIVRRNRQSDVANNSGKVQIPRGTDVLHGSRRVDYVRNGGGKPSLNPVADLDAVLPATSEDPLSPEERTAQWVLSSIAPVPKDPIVQPVGNVQHLGITKALNSTNANYDELVSCLKMDLEALSTRLCEAEESSRSFTKREEALLDQLKDRDRREARLLEKLRMAEDKIQQNMQEREEKKKEFSQRVIELETKRDRERKELQCVINEKDKIVSKQRTHIASLEESNARLIRTINELNLNTSSSTGSSSGKDSSQYHHVSSHNTGRYQNDKHASKQSRNENCQYLSGRIRHRERPVNSEMENGLLNKSPTNGEYRVEKLSISASTSSSV